MENNSDQSSTDNSLATIVELVLDIFKHVQGLKRTWAEKVLKAMSTTFPNGTHNFVLTVERDGRMVPVFRFLATKEEDAWVPTLTSDGNAFQMPILDSNAAGGSHDPAAANPSAPGPSGSSSTQAAPAAQQQQQDPQPSREDVHIGVSAGFRDMLRREAAREPQGRFLQLQRRSQAIRAARVQRASPVARRSIRIRNQQSGAVAAGLTDEGELRLEP